MTSLKLMFVAIFVISTISYGHGDYHQPGDGHDHAGQQSPEGLQNSGLDGNFNLTGSGTSPSGRSYSSPKSEPPSLPEVPRAAVPKLSEAKHVSTPPEILEKLSRFFHPRLNNAVPASQAEVAAEMLRNTAKQKNSQNQ